MRACWKDSSHLNSLITFRITCQCFQQWHYSDILRSEGSWPGCCSWSYLLAEWKTENDLLLLSSICNGCWIMSTQKYHMISWCKCLFIDVKSNNPESLHLFPSSLMFNVAFCKCGICHQPRVLEYDPRNSLRKIKNPTTMGHSGRGMCQCKQIVRPSWDVVALPGWIIAYRAKAVHMNYSPSNRSAQNDSGSACKALNGWQAMWNGAQLEI